ncbi:hypothetical protein ONS95_015025 [Cadophora gregata]|uniref:uncharacterized protein n=1 Tax=Cadophora gregata TaxID=51156 RepID=UPI0026DC3FE6|nr:uncharacterized protein ONS95_015025 [Cadophora gregata]KAK0106894.1 hypothetical protein ONS95_015025 [Cadophora gregata]
MASSPPPSRLTFKKLESLSSKKSNHSSDHVDDASSFTSMSSNFNATVCRVCKGAESLTSPLITCIRCRSRYHMSCTNPRLIDYRVDYTCGRCTEKRKKPATSVARVRTDGPINNQRPGETQPATDNQSNGETKTILCEAACGKPAVPPKPPSTKHLCVICAVMERSQAARKLHLSKPTTISRPFQKMKLYPLHPDDRPLVTNKRKRSFPGQSARVEGSRWSAGSKDNASHVKNPVIGRRLRVASHEDFRGQQARVSLAHTEDPSTKPTEALGANPSSVDSTTQRESPVASSESRKSAQRVDRNFLPLINSLEKRSGLYEMNGAGGNPNSSTSTVEKQLPLLEPIIAYPEKSSQGSPMAGAGADEEIPDALEPNRIARNRRLFPQPPSPMSDSSSELSSPQTPSINDDIVNDLTPAALEHELLSGSSKASSSSEMIDGFDESELDFFIQKQSQRDPSYEPEPKELLETQRWGAVDPRIVWPQRMSKDQRAQKVLEIAARASRKQCFGNILRPQLVQERMEMGWDLHQSREKRDDDEYREGIQRLEELFGVPEGILGNCVPKVLDGRLVMQERKREPEPRRPGRQKKEVPLGVFPVVGGQ